jgi:uncharacterized repeat protein (TIGR03803 family)
MPLDTVIHSLKSAYQVGYLRKRGKKELLYFKARQARSLSNKITGLLFATILLASCSGGGSSGPAPKFTVGGMVSGLSPGGSVSIQNNGTESLILNSNSAFTFPTSFISGAAYAVAITSQPTGQQCTVGSGSGTVASSNVANIHIDCVVLNYTLGGTVAGLVPGGSLTLQNNARDSLGVSSNGSFVFPASFTVGTVYAVAVTGQPAGQQCTVSSGSGTVASSNVANIHVDCVVLSYTLGGMVTGLIPGTSVTLQNAGDSLGVNSNGSFTFATPVPFGGQYNITVNNQPADQLCSVTGGSGTIGAANLASVEVDCIVRTYDIGGTVTGIQPGRSLTLLDGGGDALTLSSNGSFTFATRLVSGSTYSVAVGTQPTDQNCFVTRGSGNVAARAVTSVVVQCPFVHTLYTFGFTANGFNGGGPPQAGVILGKDGNLYGTTVSGGTGAGVFFKLTPAGAATFLFNFGAGQDGQQPCGDLVVDADGNFYGTTYRGGQYGEGTVFKMTPGGQHTVLWSFGSGSDGKKPFGSLVLAPDGSLYGTTSEGGSQALGTVFALTPAGVETVLWNFGTGLDGQTPEGRLIRGSDGNLYGTTQYGGAAGFGAAYQLTPGGTETILHSFANGADGQGPQGLIEGTDGDLFGATIGGGANMVGMAFKITKSGVETVLWTFGQGTDGRYPIAAPILGMDGNLYGVTDSGGEHVEGIVYRLTPAGDEIVLWSFNRIDGSEPFSTLFQGPDGTIYGTTYAGGAEGGMGSGTVFKVTM